MSKTQKPIVMTIDDDPVILNFIASALVSEYNVRPFTSGKTALDFLSCNSTDLILLDCQMPDATGFEVLKALRADPRLYEIPVIFLTSSIDSDSEIMALELGASDYITKPIRPRLLLTRVRLQVELLAHRRRLEALVEERTKNLNEAFNKLKAREEAVLNMLAKATELRDHDTGGHIERTTEFVCVIVEDLLRNPRPGYELTRAEADDIIRSSKLHDLGKIAMPDHVLLKQGRLTEDEYRVVQRHPLSGEQFLSEFVMEMNDSFLDTARDIAYSHHEKWDGTGYPLGLKGNSIPLSARIVAIADVYDALTSARPYKRPLSHKESIKLILENRGTHFDPYLAFVFARHEEAVQRIKDHVGNTDAKDLNAI